MGGQEVVATSTIENGKTKKRRDSERDRKKKMSAQLFGCQPKSHFNCPNKNNLGLEHTEEKSAERGGGKRRTFDSR